MMAFLQTLLAFAVVLGVLVVLHELGHYLVARWCGVKVLRFSVGMGKVIWSTHIGPDSTEWALSALPLGGYVTMLDAREEDLGELTPEDARREFTQQPVAKRIAIVAAGPIANFLLAIAIFAGLYMHGIPEPVARVAVASGSIAESASLQSGDLVTSVNGTAVSTWTDLRWNLLHAAIDGKSAQLEILRNLASGDREIRVVSLPLAMVAGTDLDEHLMEKMGLDFARPKARLGEILPDGAAARAGLKAGDVIQSINGEAVADGLALVKRLQASAGQRLQLRVARGAEVVDITVVPDTERAGEKLVGRIRAQVDTAPEMTIASASLPKALQMAVKKTWDTSSMTLSMLGKMIIGEASLKNITGPITIADYAGQTARIGAISFLSFIAFISISLGVMNLLPIPVLDGGHLLYYSLELLTGRPVPKRAGEIAQRAGLGLLMALMAVAVFNDIARLIF